MLVDFGRSIDMTSIKESSSASNVLFSGKIVSEDMECVAMREGRPWSADVDTFGLCASAHVLLFGCHMDIVYDSQSCRWQTKKKLRRYWRQDLWESMFGSLLNLTPGDSHSIRLGVLRKEFETYLRDFKVMNDVVTLLKGQHAYFHKVQS
jgi:checkpoint serine/threonine-protein kinase